jgi:hypothetical protein
MNELHYPPARDNGLQVAVNSASVGMPHRVPIAKLLLDLRMRPEQVPQLRGAIAEKAGLHNEWFHNHDNLHAGLHYRYPLVQYGCAGGKAAIMGIAAGADALAQFKQGYDGRLRMGGKSWVAPVLSYGIVDGRVETTEAWNTYRLRDWVALNGRNHAEWRGCGRLADQLAVLERAFLAHVMAFARGNGWYVERRLVAEVVGYEGWRRVACRGAELMAFDVTVRVQARLPEGVGLGKGVSLGFGRIVALDL